MIAMNDVIKAAGNEDIQLHFKGYAGPVYTEDSYYPGDPTHGVALANWNHVDESVAEDLSRLGVCLEEQHDFDVCSECGRVVRMFRPESLSMEQSWMRDSAEVGSDDDREVFCGNCVRQNPADVIDEVLSDPRRCITADNVDLSKFRFEKILSNLERGIAEGQDADPKVIADSLESMGVTRFLYVMDHASATVVSFSLYVDSRESGIINDPGEIMTSGFSVKQAMDEALQQIVSDIESGEAVQESGMQIAVHAGLSNEKHDPMLVTHEESCLMMRLGEMGGKYVREIERIMRAEGNESIEDPEEIWMSHSFRNIVFRNVGANREGEINRMRADAKKDFYAAENIRMFYRRVLPSLIQ
jgi:hypothetical protein